MKDLKGYMRNKNRSERCIVECYITEEVISYISFPITKNTIPNAIRYFSKLIGARKQKLVDHKLWKQAHHHILPNIDEV